MFGSSKRYDYFMYSTFILHSTVAYSKSFATLYTHSLSCYCSSANIPTVLALRFASTV